MSATPALISEGMGKMRAIVTGGTGLVGRALAADLVAAGYAVTVLSRRPAAAPSLPAGAQIVRWDARTGAGWSHLVDGAHVVVNLAAENIGAGRWTKGRKRAIAQSRVDAGRALAQAVAAAAEPPRVVVQASAVGYYGPGDDTELDEAAPAGADFLAGVCRGCEESVAPVAERGVRLVILRPGVVLSRDGGALPRLALPFRFFAGGPVGDGRQWFPWIHITDAVRAIRYLIDSPAAAGAFNLTAPESVRNADFSRSVGRVLRRPAALPVPAIALRLVFGEMAGALLQGQRAVPRRLGELGFAFRYPKLEAALEDLLV